MRTTRLTPLENNWQSFPTHAGSRVGNPLHRTRTVGSAQATIQHQEQAKAMDITSLRNWDLSSLLTEVTALLGRCYLHLQDRKCSSGTFSHQSHLRHTAVMLDRELPWLHRSQGNYHGRGEMQGPKTAPRCRVGLALLLFQYE